MKTIEGMPPAGENRFWFAEHQPKNTKLPLLLQLREKLTKGSRENVKLSTLVTQQGAIADEKAIIQVAEEMLMRAGRVDEFVGIIGSAS